MLFCSPMLLLVCFCVELLPWTTCARYGREKPGEKSTRPGSYEVGNRLTITEVPFLAMFRLAYYQSNVYCSASIVHEQFLISAVASCPTSGLIEVIMGTDYWSPNSTSEWHVVDKVFTHPAYSDNYFHDYGISVIKLKHKMVFTTTIRPIQMATMDLVIRRDSLLQHFGFGFLVEDNLLIGVIRELKRSYVTPSECRQKYKKFPHNITERMICDQGGQDGCYIMHGGALVYEGTLVGVVPFMGACTLFELPAVHCRVAAMRDFIDKTIAKNKD